MFDTMIVYDAMRTVPNFPKEGIMYHDITTVWKDPDSYKASQNIMKEMAPRPSQFDKVVAIEARGWVYGAVIAYELNKGFVPIRKHGKLPAETESITYGLEYGEDTLEIHKDAITKGDRVVLVDDLIVTGGSTLAAAELVERLGGQIVKIIALTDLTGLKGMDKIDAANYVVETDFSFPDK